MSNRKRASVTSQSARGALGTGGILDRIGKQFTPDEEGNVAVKEVPLKMIVANPYQPRQTFQEDSIKELGQSIQKHGFYGHLLVRQKGRRYELVYGERRLRAAQSIGMEKLPVQIRELEDAEMLEIAITENVQREDLHPVDEAQAYDRMRQELGCSIRDIADKIGKSKSYVATLLSVLRYPEITEAVRTADLPIRTAEELAKIDDEALRKDLLTQVLAGNLDRNDLIQRRQDALEKANQSAENPKPVVRNADVSKVIPTFKRTMRKLKKQPIGQLSAEEKPQAIAILKEIAAKANEMIIELADDI